MRKYVLFIFILSLFSCSGFLELQPEHQINEHGFYKDVNDYETAVLGTYDGLQRLYNAALIYVGELTTDNAEVVWTSPTAAEVEFNESRFTPTNSFLGSIWSRCYKIISQSNNILDRLPNLDAPEETVNNIKGEALFLRAYGYFYLVRLFGDLQLVDVSFTSPDEVYNHDMSRKPAEVFYELIETDLLKAMEMLNNKKIKSRPSKGTAKALLGKVYLTQKKYDEAAKILEQIIDSGEYSLVPEYQRLFTNGNDNLVESIFEIEYLSGNVGEGNSYSTYFTPARFDMAIFPNNMQGNGRILPTPEMAAAYEEGDLRRPVSIRDSIFTLSGTYEKDLFGLKFVDFTTGVSGDGGVNFTAIRYADVLLMYSEALNELEGKEIEAHKYLNKVRKRAGLNDVTGLSKEELRYALEKERRVEFFLEGHRWFDLLRTGRLQGVMNTYYETKGLAFRINNHELLMPIPQREIDVDPSLRQNPGY